MFSYAAMFYIADHQSIAKSLKHLKLVREGVSGFWVSLQTKCCFSDHVNMGYCFVSQVTCNPRGVLTVFKMASDARHQGIWVKLWGIPRKKINVLINRTPVQSVMPHYVVSNTTPRGLSRDRRKLFLSSIFGINVYSNYL